MVTDLRKNDAAQAAIVEVQADGDDSYRFDFNGDTYAVKKNRTTSYDFLEMFQDKGNIAAYRWLIGDDQWTRFRQANLDSDGLLQTAVVQEFFRAVDAALIADPGEGQGN